MGFDVAEVRATDGQKVRGQSAGLVSRSAGGEGFELRQRARRAIEQRVATAHPVAEQLGAIETAPVMLRGPVGGAGRWKMFTSKPQPHKLWDLSVLAEGIEQPAGQDLDSLAHACTRTSPRSPAG